MGKLLLEKFQDCIETIKTQKIKDFTIKVIESCLDIHALKPASSSGKYHPVIDLGEGGLVRHSIMTATLADIMCRAFNDESTKMQLERDIIYSAALIHDMHKYKEGIEHTLRDHAVRMANDIRKMNTDNDPDIAKIADDVETHMSRFGGDAARPKTIGQYIVSFADLVSASKELPMIMEDLKRKAEIELNIS